MPRAGACQGVRRSCHIGGVLDQAHHRQPRHVGVAKVNARRSIAATANDVRFAPNSGRPQRMSAKGTLVNLH